MLALIRHIHEFVEPLRTHLLNTQLRDLLLQVTPKPVTHAGYHAVTCCDLVADFGDSLYGIGIYWPNSSFLASAIKGELDLDDTDLLGKAWHEALSAYGEQTIVTSLEAGIDTGRLGAMVENEIQQAERLLRAAQPRPPKGSNGGNDCPIVVGLEQNNVTVDNVEYALQPHHVQILNALVESRESGEWWVTGGGHAKAPGLSRNPRLPRNEETQDSRATAQQAHQGAKPERLPLDTVVKRVSPLSFVLSSVVLRQDTLRRSTMNAVIGIAP